MRQQSGTREASSPCLQSQRACGAAETAGAGAVQGQAGGDAATGVASCGRTGRDTIGSEHDSDSRQTPDNARGFIVSICVAWDAMQSTHAVIV